MAKCSGAGSKGGGRTGERGGDDSTVQVYRRAWGKLEGVCKMAREAASSSGLGRVLQQRNGFDYSRFAVL